jgi:hypothetical protein
MALCLIFLTGICLAQSPLTLTGKGVATIDGVMSPGEWGGAGHVDLVVKTPGGGTTPATLYVMNDNLNLYVALRFNRTIVDPGNSLVFEFDNNNNGIRENGDDAFGFTPPNFFDDFRTGADPCPPGSLCGFYDSLYGGVNNGQGAFLNNGTFTVYEMSHPLNSGDILHDFVLSAGQTVGFYLELRMIGIGGDFGDTTFPDFGFGQIVIQPYVLPTLTGKGIATIDGVLSPGEWDGAGKFNLSVRTPDGGTTPATLYVMNDNLNMYVALRFNRTIVDPGNTLAFEFDNNNDGIRENGDDVFGFTPPIFFDDFRTNAPPCPPGSGPASCAPGDPEGGGTVDGQGAFLNNGTFSVYEMAHPLNSGDIGHDFVLNGGQTVGFYLFLRMMGPDAQYPQGFADTFFPDFGGFGHILIQPFVPPVLTGCGVATIDGVLSPGEWDSAARFNLSVKVPGGGSTPATLYVMNNHLNLYVALRFNRTIVDPGNTLSFEFDNNNNGVAENGDDVIGFNPPFFFDDFRTDAPPCPPGSGPASCAPGDPEGGGTVDGQGAFLNNGTFSVYEMSHPLNSGDIGHDFVLNGGQTVGFFLFLRMIGPDAQYPQGLADTFFPGFRNYGSILICAYSPQQRIALLKQDVAALVSGGVLTTADTKIMLRSLDDALDRLSQQKVKQAIDELEKFIKEVDKLVKKGKLSTAQGQTLIGAATIMINQLSTPNLAHSRNEGAVEEAVSDIPADFGLDVNYPNPFNPKTIISYQIPAEGLVMLRVYNLLGQEVATLVNGNLRAGRHSVTFDASHLPSGTYIYTLQFGDKVASKAMVLMK